MRTNIVIDDEFMADTPKATGLNTKREVAVEQGPRRIYAKSLAREYQGYRVLPHPIKTTT